MRHLPTNRICTMTELREPQKVLDRAGGKPVAILKNSQLVGYIVPAEAVGTEEHRYATLDEVMVHVEATHDEVQSVLDYLKDR